MKYKNKKGYSLIETTVGILLIAMASIIIIIGTKAALSGYTEGRKIHAINERLMTSAEIDGAGDDKITYKNDYPEVTIKALNPRPGVTTAKYEFKGKYKSYTDVDSKITYIVFE